MNEAPLQVILGRIPSKSNSYRSVGSKMLKSATMRDYERSFVLQCNIYKNAGITEPFAIVVDAYLANPSQDLDGIFKGLLDLLEDVGAISNDKNCIRIVADKHIDKKNPRIEFRIVVNP